ncbi:MAG: hypothetical protein ACREKM_08290 [Longimicrobiales bacterium]
MKQRLETVSAVLVVLVIGLAWFNDREQPSDSAGLSVIEAAQPAAHPLAMAAEARSPVQQQDVPCSREREADSKRIKTTGGEIKVDYARVVFPQGAYESDMTVHVIPHDRLHGITIRPAPRTPVRVLMRLRYCGEEPTDRYWIRTKAGHIPADPDESGFLLWKRYWAAAEVPTEAWDGIDPSIRTGFVILSN